VRGGGHNDMAGVTLSKNGIFALVRQQSDKIML
jgi:hypothetical protein